MIWLGPRGSQRLEDVQVARQRDVARPTRPAPTDTASGLQAARRRRAVCTGAAVGSRRLSPRRREPRLLERHSLLASIDGLPRYSRLRPQAPRNHGSQTVILTCRVSPGYALYPSAQVPLGTGIVGATAATLAWFGSRLAQSDVRRERSKRMPRGPCGRPSALRYGTSERQSASRAERRSRGAPREGRVQLLLLGEGHRVGGGVRALRAQHHRGGG